MLRQLNCSFKMESGSGGHQSTCSASSKKGGLVVIGLQSIIQIPEEKSNVVIKSAIRKSGYRPANSVKCSCYLKSCHLCKKNFFPEKDIYMYRGDLGFCSVECRNWQIALDEMKELGASTKQKLIKCHGHSGGQHETGLLSEGLRRRNKTIPSVKRRAIVS